MKLTDLDSFEVNQIRWILQIWTEGNTNKTELDVFCETIKTGFLRTWQLKATAVFSPTFLGRDISDRPIAEQTLPDVKTTNALLNASTTEVTEDTGRNKMKS